LRAHLVRRRVALRVAVVPILQMAVGAGLAYFVAHNVLGHTQSFFAPIAAAIVLRVAPGLRTRRALEMVVGIAVGIGVADLLIRWIGTGAWQIGLVVALATTVAVLLGAGPLIASQAAGTAVLVVAVPNQSAAPTRFVDALVGGLIGLLVLVVVPSRPLSAIRRAVNPFLAETASVYRAAADALGRRDAAAASAALRDSYELGRLGSTYTRVAEQGREVAMLSPVRWSELPLVERYIQASTHIDSLARDSRVLCRGVRTAIETGEDPPPELAAAIFELADAIDGLGALLSSDQDDGELIGRALGAAAAATACLDDHSSLAMSLIVSQARSAAVDLLRALGVERLEARAHLASFG
jgi:uncharacterized membrane protein YgaE (UPF0421/DUF939 family)